MTTTRLTLRRLRAMENAVSAMEAGEQGEGDWGPDVSREDMEAALDWIGDQISKRHKALNQQTARAVANRRSSR